MFSVLLSVYQKEQASYLRQSLESIFAQTLLPDEIVLVKDGPLTDMLDQVIEEYCQKYSMIKIVPLMTNQGLGKALSEGMKHCSYDLIARMDTDDISMVDRFEKQVNIFKKNPEIDVVGAWISEFEEDIDNIVTIRKLPETSEEILKFARQRNPINHPVVMFRKSAVLKAGNYQDCPFFEDYYLWVRMLLNGSRFYNIPQSLLFFRFSSDVFKRRGGWNYARHELHFQKKLWDMKFINGVCFCKNVSMRFISRIIPNHMRMLLYKKVLRK